jgi:hypothetical protein
MNLLLTEERSMYDIFIQKIEKSKMSLLYFISN